MKVLMVLTSHDKLGDTGEKTGFWLEEFAAPYYVLHDAGATITLASPDGGQPPLDPKSDDESAQTDATRRFKSDKQAQEKLANTYKLKDVRASDFDAIFYPGGHGPLWDLATHPYSIELIQGFIGQMKPVAAVCHAPAVFLNVQINGEHLLKGKTVTGFSNSEEDAVGLTDIVPYMLEDELKARGATYQKTDDWGSLSIVDGLVITGQNPGSSEAVAKDLLAKLR